MMTDPKIDGWYRAVGNRATFAFRVEGGEVVECAPYGRKIIMGLRWGTAYMKLERGGFEVGRLLSDAAVGEPAAVTGRAKRFNECVSKIEVMAERLRLGLVEDIFHGLFSIREALDEAEAIFGEVSREALDKVTTQEGGPGA